MYKCSYPFLDLVVHVIGRYLHANNDEVLGVIGVQYIFLVCNQMASIDFKKCRKIVNEICR